jgi:hypothetical protein
MKNIKELNLELIELEDEVLLVDDKKLIINSCIQRGTEKPVINKPDFWFDFGVPYKNVIASTKQLKGIPLLVIEDELDEIVESHFNIKNPSDETRWKKALWKDGFKTAKETFKFTEEDLRKALWELGDVLFNNNQSGIKEGEPELYFDTIIQSLNKKELWIEVECSGRNCIEEYGCTAEVCNNVKSDIPKIENNKIKAVWK